MAEFDIGQASTTNLSNEVLDVKIASQIPDGEGEQKETVWEFPDAPKHLGYYHEIPELKSALHVLGQRVCGLGWTTETARDSIILERIRGWGEDSIDSILIMMLIESKVFGDSFAEIVRSENGTIINLKKLYTGDMRVIVDESGLIKRYEQRSHVKGESPKKFETHEIFHLCNDRIGNEIHGTSIINGLKKIIDAKNEALSDERKIRHRELALGILYIDSEDSTKRDLLKRKYADAINKGEMLVLPEGTARIESSPNNPRDRIQWLQYLDNLFYQVVGTPKVLVTSEGFTEAGGKAGLLAFEPVELSEKRKLEQDIWNQLGIRIKFNRAPSLLGNEQETQQKNSGQVGIQNNETQVNASRTE